MKHILIIILLLVSLCTKLNAQNFDKLSDQGYSGFVQISGIGTTDGQVPFWMRTNNFGSIPLDGVSGSIVAGFKKDYYYDSLTERYKKIDWGVGIEYRGNGGRTFDGQFLSAYFKVKYAMFQAKIGRSKDIMGIVDSSLSSGAFAVSGNALGIPKLEISIPDYWRIPAIKGIFSIKGNFALGYVGSMEMVPQPYIYTDKATTYFHQKSFYARIGKENWKLQIYGGFNHQVMWGHEKEYLGPDYHLGQISSAIYAIIGKVYGNNGLPYSKIGNHIGSVDQSISYNFQVIKLNAYHQFFYDVGGLVHLNNIKDGLWGLSVMNSREEKGDVNWSKILIEVMNSKSQGGELKSKVTPSGDENYYNNYVYYKGWTYENQNIGNNFLTNKQYQRKELPQFSDEYIGNNRVLLLHLGAEWGINGWHIVNKLSFSRNYGTYATSPIGNTTGRKRTIQPPPYFTSVSQFSGLVDVSHALPRKYSIEFVFATDYGNLIYNSLGGIIKLTKSF